MANYQLLKADIDAKVYQNARQKITGENLNSVLNAMVTTLGAEYQFAGVATIGTNPGTPDAKVFYIANGKGTYTNFGGLEVTEDDVVILYYDTTWHKVETGIAPQEKLTELESDIGTKFTELDGKFQEKLRAGDGIKIEGNVISNDFDHSEFATKESVEQGLLGKQDVIPDLDSIRDGAYKGSTALQEHQDISHLATKNELSSGLDGKQDIIPDLESIREGATKGSTALQEHQDISHLLPKSVFEAYETKNDGEVQLLKDIDDRMKLLLGFNASRSIVNLELGVSGKYVKCESRSAVDNSSFAISKPFEVDACSELLIKTGFNPSDAAHSGLDLTVIAIYEEIERQRTVQKKDESGNPLYYVVTVDEETGSETVTTDETTENTGYPVYTQETYTEQRYLPNNEDRFVAIPDSGYYVANIPQSCKLVISYKPGVSDTAVIVEKHGALANLISQVFGIYEHRTMVEAMVSLAARVDALESRQGLLGNATAGTLDVSELTKCLYPTILKGHGVPSATNVPVNLPAGLPWDGVPVFIGQLYINLDAASGGLYYAVGHESVANWKQA